MTMKKNHLLQNSCAVLAAFIWGFAFVTQSVGAQHMGPFTMNAARSVIACAVMGVVCLSFRKMRGETWAQSKEKNPRYLRELLLGGVCCGTALTVANNLQQKGIETTTSGKAGFLTALYIVIVPVLGLLLKKRAARTVWVGVGTAVAGLYFLCVQENLSIAPGDFYILLAAVFFSLQILLVDHFVQGISGMELAFVQTFTVMVLSGIGMVVLETPTWADIRAAIWPLLYLGVFSSGVAYTLQIIAQKGSNPTVISLLLSLESVFATLSGALVLGEGMNGREYVGCALMLGAVVLAQLPSKGQTLPVPDGGGQVQD